MVSTSNHVLRTSQQTTWFLVGMPGAVLVFSSMVTLKEPSFWLPTTMVAIMLVIAIFLVKTTSLSLSHDAIHYQSLLRKVDIALADVVKVESAFGFVAFSYKPYQRIIITVRKTSADKEIILNGGLFDQREIKQWVKECGSAIRCSSRDPI